MSVSTMKKLTVLAYSTDAEAVVRKLMNLRCVEMRPARSLHGNALSFVDCDAQKAEAERRLQSIRLAIPHLVKYTTRKKKLGRSLHRVDRDAFVREGRDKTAWRTVEETLTVVNDMARAQEKGTRARALMDSLLPWLEYDAPLNASGSAKTDLYLVGGAKIDAKEDALAAIEAAGGYPEVVSEEEHGLYLSLTCHKDDSERIDRVLTEYGFLKTAFPELSVTARVAYENAEAEELAAETEYLRLEEQLRELSQGLDDVEILCDLEATTVTVCLQKRKLATTKNCVLLEGWVPSFMEDRVTDALSKFECACELAVPDKDEEPPVLLRNNKFAANFEWVIGMYSYPKYGTFDPTFIMSIFYFIIFGLMFADVGYGLLLVLACFGGVKLLNPKPGLRRMMMMFGYCGFSCIAMGVIFGGWFGDLPVAIMTNLLHLPVDTGVGHFFASGLWFNPLDDPMTFLIVSLAVGAVHLIAGMAIRFVELCKRGAAMEAICTILPYWVLFLGLGLLLVNTTVGGYVALVGALMILFMMGYGQKGFFAYIKKGLGGLYNLISYASDLLSYSRILALGLVAGVIAKVINLITMMGDGNPVGFVIMLIVLIAGHLLNIAINLLGTFIHASRLQYLEFFGKFFEDGGVPFEPVAPAEEFSEDPYPTPNPNVNANKLKPISKKGD